MHITRDQFAAENHHAGESFIDIITQPGVGPIRGSANSTLRAGSLTARNPFAQERGVDQNQRYGLTVGGALAKDKSSFSLNVNGSHQLVAPFVHVATPGGTRTETLNVKSPVDQHGLQALVETTAHARPDALAVAGPTITRHDQRNQGIGAYDLPGRAYSSSNTSHYARLQHAGPVGRRIFVNTRGYVAVGLVAAVSRRSADHRVVPEFTSGGAQHRGGDRQRFVNLSSDLDYIGGINSWRTGVQLNTFKSDSDNEDNYLGTYTFPDTTAYKAGSPSLYTRRIGDPRVSYHDVSLGAVRAGRSARIQRPDAQSRRPLFDPAHVLEARRLGAAIRGDLGADAGGGRQRSARARACSTTSCGTVWTNRRSALTAH